MPKNETTETLHDSYCDRLEEAMNNMRERGEDFIGISDPRLQYEILSQIESGYSCDCAARGLR